MIINKPAAQGIQVMNNTLAIPIGTNTIFAYDKFMWDSRDLNCTACKNGMKSMITKRINDKQYNVPVVCTCVPYIESQDEDGVSIVVFKGRRERWVKGKRPESYKVDEGIRGKANTAALNTKAMVSGQNEVAGRKFQLVRKPTQQETSVSKSEFLSKSIPGAPIRRAPEVPLENMTSNENSTPKFGDVTEKSLPPLKKGPQKTLHVMPNGNRVFVDDKTFAKLSGQPLQKSVTANQPVNTNPTGKKRGRPSKNVSIPPVSKAVQLTEAQALAKAVGMPLAAEAPASTGTVEKKKRGRPRKIVAS
jgi:hypothetical protein